MSSKTLMIKDDLYQFDGKKDGKIPSDMLVIKDDLYQFDDGVACGGIPTDKKYLIECPFESIKDNEIPLDACRGCYWNNGVINNLEGVPVKVKCQYMYKTDFVVQVFSDYHGE
jgi:hypothetical protein